MIIALATAFSALALMNTAAMATAERRTELATIRLFGGTTGPAIRMVTLETLPTVLPRSARPAIIAGIAVNGVPTRPHRRPPLDPADP